METSEVHLNIQTKEQQRQRRRRGLRITIFGLFMNILLAATKLVAGHFAGSLAVTADGFNNVSDTFSSLVSISSFYVSSKPADKEHPFGHARLEYIASSIIAFGMLLVAVQVGYRSVLRIIRPEPLALDALTFGSLILSIAIKSFLFFYYRRNSRKLGSPVMHAAAGDSLADVLATSGVLLSTILFAVWGINVDGPAGLIVSLMILWSAIDLIRSMATRLIGARPDDALLAMISEEIIRSDPRIHGVHDLIIHDYGPGTMFASAHVELDSRESFIESHILIDHIERNLLAKYGIQTVLHADPAPLSDARCRDIQARLDKVSASIGDHVMARGLLLYKTDDQPVIAFDVLLPDDVSLKDDDVSDRYREVLSKEWPEFVIHLTIQRQYQTTSQEVLPAQKDTCL